MYFGGVLPAGVCCVVPSANDKYCWAWGFACCYELCGPCCKFINMAGCFPDTEYCGAWCVFIDTGVMGRGIVL